MMGLDTSPQRDPIRIDRVHACRHARRIVGDDAVAEDMVQETLLRVLKVDTDLDQPRDFQRYFYKSLTNTCINRLRQVKVEVRAIRAHPRPLVELPSEIERLERRELLELVDAALQRLPWRERVSIVLRQWDDHSYREIGEALGITETHAATLVYRGLRRLRAQFEEEEEEERT